MKIWLLKTINVQKGCRESCRGKSSGGFAICVQLILKY
jgi:hypothetical protein